MARGWVAAPWPRRGFREGACRVLLPALVWTGGSGCDADGDGYGGGAPGASGAARAAVSTGVSGSALPAESDEGPPPLTGTVVEALAGGRYTFVRLKSSSGERWAVVSKTALEPGTDVVIERPVRVHDFASPELERRFATVYFGVLQGAPPPPPRTAGPAPRPLPDTIAVPKARAANGFTVAEVVQQQADLAGKTVTIRAMVVKTSADILGRHWIHIQDGTGSKKQGSHDLLVTSDQLPPVGQVVQVTGTVATNREVDKGLVFPLLVERATWVPAAPR